MCFCYERLRDFVYAVLRFSVCKEAVVHSERVKANLIKTCENNL